jgi:aspartate ammonia-lyase
VRGGSLELNAFLPLIADCLLENLDVLARADDVLARLCVDGIEADEARCRAHVENSTAAATALVPRWDMSARARRRGWQRSRGRRCV